MLNNELGFWEKENRNPLVASFLVIFIIGSIYFTGGAIVLNFLYTINVFIFKRKNFAVEADFLSSIKENISQFKYPILIVTSIFQFGILLLLTLFIFRKWHNKPMKEYFQFNKISLIGMFLSPITILLLIPFVDFTSKITFYFFPILRKLQEVALPLYTAKNKYDFLLLIFFIGVTPAICEEIFFRGYFQKTLSRKIKEPYHYILSGFVFALFHQNALGLPALTVVGVYLGLIFFRFKSIYVSMISHFIYNSFLITLVNFSDLNLLSFLLDKNKNFNNITILISSFLFIIFILIIFFTTRDKSTTSYLKSITD